MASIEVKSKTLKELLSDVTYSIDYYQREYRWDRQQITDLVEDLSSKFLDYYKEGDARTDVVSYGNYFLGSIILASREDSARYLIDGQQRLTSLTLLIIYLRRRLVSLRGDYSEQIGRLSQMIFSETFGAKSFNINIPERNAALQRLYEGKGKLAGEKNLSVDQIFNNYELIEKIFPNEINNEILPYFIDWLLEKVELVEMSSGEVNEAYTTFETMNDRGKPINPADVIKGFILSQIRNKDRQEEANEKWKKLLDRLRDEDSTFEIDFFKHWLRAKYAIESRKTGVGTLNQDFEKIKVSSEIARWVRANPEKLGAQSPEDFYKLATVEMPFFAQVFLRIQEARKNLTSEQPFLFYNSFRKDFAHENQLLMAPLESSDTPEEVETKLLLVSMYVDIYLARRTLADRLVKEAGIKNTMVNLIKELRQKTNPEELAAFLKQRVADMKKNEPGFERLPFYTLGQRNNTQTHWVLARFTNWLEVESGRQDNFAQLIGRDQKKPIEIEHLLASNRQADYSEEFDGQEGFNLARNQLGALILIPSRINQSLGDKDYLEKLDAYRKTNLWAQALHGSAYNNDPGFLALIKKHKLSFEPHEEKLTKEFLDKRNALMIQIAEIIWNEERFDFALPEEKRGEWAGRLIDSPKGEKTKKATMQDMLRAGKVRAGDTLSGSYKGKRATCKILANGKIEAKDPRGKIITGTLTGVAKKLFPEINSISGWVFWKAGGGRSLDEIRADLEGK